MSKITHPTRRMAAGLAASALALTLTACSPNPRATQMSYDPAEGYSAEAGPIALRNLMVVAPAAGTDGVLNGVAANRSNGDLELRLSTPQDPNGGVTVTVPAKGSVRLDQSDLVWKTSAAPGTLTTVVLSVSGGSTSVTVPVVYPAGSFATLLAPGVTLPSPSSSAAPTSAAAH